MNKKIIIIVSSILVVGVGIYIYLNMNFEDVTEGKVTVNNITLDESTKLNIDKILLGSWYVCSNDFEFVYYEDNTGVRISSDNTEQFEWKLENNILYINNDMGNVEFIIEFINDNNEMILSVEDIEEKVSLYRECPLNLYNK